MTRQPVLLPPLRVPDRVAEGCRVKPGVDRDGDKDNLCILPIYPGSGYFASRFGFTGWNTRIPPQLESSRRGRIDSIVKAGPR